jgi:urease accessory protein
VDASAAKSALPASAGWEAELRLLYGRRGDRTVLVQSPHRGPLVVQKSLYPEGECVCQNLIVHPPGGIVGGDRLTLDVHVSAGAWAQLATPGAAKWYRSAGANARQSLRFEVERGGVLEWLPQEAIVFDGALVELETEIDLAGDAIFIGWEIACLGRSFAGERFASGRLAQRTIARRDGARQWIEQARFDATSRLLASPVGLAGQPVFGTLLALVPAVSDSLVAACREIECDAGEVALTRLPGVLIARYRGASVEAARDYFAQLWSVARPVLAARPAKRPRIWST